MIGIFTNPNIAKSEAAWPDFEVFSEKLKIVMCPRYKKSKTNSKNTYKEWN